VKISDKINRAIAYERIMEIILEPEYLSENFKISLKNIPELTLLPVCKL
jgi:hypothetical protein